MYIFILSVIMVKCNNFSIILQRYKTVKQQSVMDQLEKTKLELTSIKQELKVLRQTHQFTIMQLAQSRENEQKYKKLNDTLMQGIQSNKVNISPLPGITLNIEGQFGCRRCIDLEKQLESYRTGVNFSIQRRVKQIAKNFTELQQEDRKKSRVSCSRITNHINYNAPPKQCQNCMQIQKEMAHQQKLIEQAISEYEEKIADRDILAAKINKMEALIKNLEEQNIFLENQLAKYKDYYEQNQRQQSWDYFNGTNEKKSRISVGRHAEQKSSKMMQQITNIVSCLSNKKYQDDKRKSRAFQTNDPSLFSIKNGINRPGTGYF